VGAEWCSPPWTYTYRERHGEAIYRFKHGMLPKRLLSPHVVLSFQEDAIGIRLRDVIGVRHMMWGSDYPHSESTFSGIAEDPGGDPGRGAGRRTDQIAGGNTARVYNFDVARLTVAA